MTFESIITGGIKMSVRMDHPPLIPTLEMPSSTFIRYQHEL